MVSDTLKLARWSIRIDFFDRRIFLGRQSAVCPEHCYCHTLVTEGNENVNGKVLSRLASFGLPCGLLLLALYGTASAQSTDALITAVPEIDPGTAASGLAVLAGAALLLIERFRRRQGGGNA